MPNEPTPDPTHNPTATSVQAQAAGLWLGPLKGDSSDWAPVLAELRAELARWGLAEGVTARLGPLPQQAAAWAGIPAAFAPEALGQTGVQLVPQTGWLEQLAPGFDTLSLRENARVYLGDTPVGVSEEAALGREIWLAWLLSPFPWVFPSLEECRAALRMRVDIALGAGRTALAFETAAAERPADCWSYDDDRGFTLLPGVALDRALRKATQPDVSGQLYSFSCYRATEYVILLGLAQELARSNPEWLARLEAHWQQRCVMSGAFHDSFLREYGSLEQPVPPLYYVPGDRVWFRNPDERSADVSGYEGSWTIYLGQGLFANFWQRDRPFTLRAKCVEVFHWRDAVYQDAEGEPRIDESIVAQAVAATLADPQAEARVVQRMLRLRDGRGIYAEGGCIDATRECLRWVCPASLDLSLPAL